MKPWVCHRGWGQGDTSKASRILSSPAWRYPSMLWHGEQSSGGMRPAGLDKVVLMAVAALGAPYKADQCGVLVALASI